MEYRQMGKTGLRVSMIGVGNMTLSGQDTAECISETIRTLKA